MKRNLNYNRLKRIFVLTSMIFFSVFACSSREMKPEKKVIAKIGYEELTLDMLKEAIPHEQSNFLTHEQLQNYIQRWIDHELIYQQALRLGMYKDPELIQVRKKAEKDFLVNKLLDSLLTTDISISEQEIQDYYKSNKANFVRAKPEIRALHILVSNSNEARTIRQRIMRGEDFKTVAKEVSLDYSRNKRIDMGYFSSDNVVPEIAASLFNWQTGSVTQPIRSEFGYHIFKILDKKEANSDRSVEEVRNQIIDRLMAGKREEYYRNYVTSLKSRIEIKTNYEYLNEFYSTDTSDTNQAAMKDTL